MRIPSVIPLLAALVLVGQSAPAQSLALTVNTNACIPLPPDAAWNQYVNFRPTSNVVVNFNPPIFNWCYVPGSPSTGANDVQEYNFVFQVGNDNTFNNPAINLTTPCNFYNFLPPLQNTNGIIYWRVGYVSVVNNTTNAWITNSFQISGSAITWDRSMMTNASYLSGRVTHPHMGFNATNRAALANWVVTNQIRWVQNSLADCQGKAVSTWSQSWYTNYSSQTDANNNGVIISQYLTDVAFMWQMTRNSYWTNQNPTPVTVFTNLVNWYMTNYYDMMDDVQYDPTPEWWVNFAYFYDWMYDAMDAGQRGMFTNAFHYRALYLRDGIGWWRRPSIGSPGNAYTPTNRIYPSPYYVRYISDAKNGNTHAHQNFETDFPMLLSAFGDESTVSNVFTLGANYCMAYCSLGGHDGGLNQGRGYNKSEAYGPGAQALFNWNNAMALSIAFPELQVALNPTFQQTAQFMDMETPVNFYEFNDPWGCGSQPSGNDNYFSVVSGRWQINGIMAAFTTNGDLQTHQQADNALNFDDGYPYVPYNFILPYSFPAPGPTTTSVLAQCFTNDGYVIGLSSPPSQAACYASGVGFIFAARPRGSMASTSTGHSTVNDLDFQIWAYGANVTDAGDYFVDTLGAGIADCSWSHYAPTINGIGQFQNSDEQTHPWYSRIIAFTNAPDFVYCAADGTQAYPIDQRLFEDGCWQTAYGALATIPGNLLTGLTSVTRQILFEHRKYFVIFDSFSATTNYTYAIPYHIMDPTLANQSGATFTYTCTNQANRGSPITVYVSQVVNSSLLGVKTMTGTNVKSNPITGENYWLPTNYFERSYAIWVSNVIPTNNFHFMTVIYPVPPGGAAPVIQRMDDYTVSVTAGGQADVISFDPNTTNAATFVINSPAIIATGNPDFTIYPTGAATSISSGGAPGAPPPMVTGPPSSPQNLRVLVPWTTGLLSAFTPVTGYFAWWNPDTLLGSNNTIPVPSWVDNSSGLIANQAVAALQPMVEVQAQNVHNYLQFNGAEALQYTNYILSQPCEIFIATQAANSAAGGYSVLLGDNSYIGSLTIGTYNGQYCIYSHTSATSGSIATGGTLGTNWQIITAILNGANSQLFVNGAPVINCSINGAATMSGVCIGSFDNGGNGQSWNGAIGDVLIYTNTLSVAKQQANENNLRAKYGF